MKHHLLVEKDKSNTCRKNQEKTKHFFWRIFLEVTVFMALTVPRGAVNKEEEEVN
jgi:hypothetical protein